MKISFVLVLFAVFNIFTFQAMSQKTGGKQLFLDVHQVEPGKVQYEDVAKAHARDIEVGPKYGATFLKYWVNKDKGLIYCLVEAKDSSSIRKAHAEAHGLLPKEIFSVTDGIQGIETGKKNLYLDVHQLGAGKVSAKDVAAAHQKDLATQSKYGANFINYWFDEKKGVVMCLVEAKNEEAVIKTHKEAHGLLPTTITKVKEGQ